ncbi:MAG TPA: hypothetical protein CFH81_04540 [Sulfurovum sp. UBA12169]|nr:MAG TPA: hypothetical protein CFH81_04540 [Sulfurovum sp. UBA12169]
MPQGATVPFFKYQMGEDQIIEFDTSRCGPPEPMVNAMIGLKMVDEHTKLLMINHKRPMGLLEKVQQNFNLEEADTEEGNVQLLFSHKAGESEKANLNDSACHG